MKQFFIPLSLCLILFTSCMTTQYANEKQSKDFASMQEVIDSVPAADLPVNTASTHNFWPDNSPNVYYSDRHYRTTAKPYSVNFTEAGTYEIRIKTAINTLGSTVCWPTIELFAKDKTPIEIRKTYQKVQDAGLMEPPCILTIFETTIVEPGKYYLIASADLTQKKDLILNVVDQYGNHQGTYTCHESPYGMYTTKITRKADTK